MNDTEITKIVLERFLRYVKIFTTSNRNAETIPSTSGQWDLLNLLVTELTELGIKEINLNENGYLIARIPGRGYFQNSRCIGLLAHVDTNEDITGEGVNPQIIENYDGGVIPLGENYALDPAEYPELQKHRGETIITTDGTTLLGADDKAGIAEIITAVQVMLKDTTLPMGPLELIFTPDEETGQGMDLFPIETLLSKYCYTVDGDERDTLEAECFTAYKAVLNFTGRAAHPGYARGELINAMVMASSFLSMLPRSESPEATDGYYGYYLPIQVNGTMESVTLEMILRDFEQSGMERRIEAVNRFAKAVEAAFPGGRVEVTITKQYENMKTILDQNPESVELAKEAIRLNGGDPKVKYIRGGTDGARLCEKGIPTPNLFTGGHNFHSRYEWISREDMTASVKTIINLIQLWAEQQTV